eukprot:6196571-Pleurochrysis_carterae.AAC.3
MNSGTSAMILVSAATVRASKALSANTLSLGLVRCKRYDCGHYLRIIVVAVAVGHIGTYYTED